MANEISVVFAFVRFANCILTQCNMRHTICVAKTTGGMRINLLNVHNRFFSYTSPIESTRSIHTTYIVWCMHQSMDQRPVSLISANSWPLTALRWFLIFIKSILSYYIGIPWVSGNLGYRLQTLSSQREHIFGKMGQPNQCFSRTRRNSEKKNRFHQKLYFSWLSRQKTTIFHDIFVSFHHKWTCVAPVERKSFHENWNREKPKTKTKQKSNPNCFIPRYSYSYTVCGFDIYASK